MTRQISLLVLFLGLCTDAAEVPVLKLGSPLPDFSLPGTDGRTYTPRDFAEAKLVAIIFTCNHCPTAQAYEERIKQLAADYQPRGVAIVAINPNSNDAVRLDELGYTDLADSLEEMKIRAAHKQFNFPYLDDGPTEKFSKQLGPIATPHVFIFDADRKLRYQGRIDNNEREDLVKTQDTRAALDALLAGKQPAVAETKVFGCSTKWDNKIESNRRWREKVQKEPVKLEAAPPDLLREIRANKTDKLRLVNVWATWCGPCVAEFDELVETNLRFRHRDFEMITIAAQFPDEKDKVQKFLEKHHASSRNYYFADTDKYKMFEALDPEWKGGLPHTLLIAPGGEVVYRATEELDFLELRRKIVPALNKITPWPGMSDAK
jgi:thiol-disulfide isomerase/thioredoxin